MSEPKTYKAKLIDHIGTQVNWLFEEYIDKTGTLTIGTDNRLHFTLDDILSTLTTSEIQSNPIHENNKLIFVTRNSTYEFEILGEVDKSA
jgi:hypothetical protein